MPNGPVWFGQDDVPFLSAVDDVFEHENIIMKICGAD